MKSWIFLSLGLALSGCGGSFGRINAEVVVVGLLPSVSPAERSSAVLYRVIAPVELAGKYGVDYTGLSAAEVEKKKGAVFKITRLGKWRYLLSESAPLGASVGREEDFFKSATPK